MKKTHIKTRMVFTIMLVCILAFLQVPGTVEGEYASAKDITGFDNVSLTGVANHNASFVTAPASIRLAGGWGDFEFDDFKSGIIRFNLRSYKLDYFLHIYLIDDDNPENKILVKISAHQTPGTSVVEGCRIQVKDFYNKDTDVVWEEKDGPGVKIYKHWQEVRLTLEDTSTLLEDGDLYLRVDLGDEKDFVKVKLISKFNGKIRAFNRVTFKSKAQSDIFYLDDIMIQVDESTILNLNYLFVGGTLSIIAIVYVRPFSKKSKLRKLTASSRPK